MMPTLSIITPTWNRARYLPRVLEGLAAQTCRDFEWIVSDDGSSDDTKAVMLDLAQRANFRVLYLKADKHVGKARMDNEAITRARGSLTIWCDSDDFLLPHAVEQLITAWHSIPLALRGAFVGVSALAATKDGIIVDPIQEGEDPDIPWNDLAQRFGSHSDMIYMARTDALRAHPFPEVDLVIPESVVWNAIGHLRAKLVPQVLLIKEYRAPNAISFSGKMSYNRGRAYALAAIERYLRPYRALQHAPWPRIVTFLRYSLHGEIGLAEARRLWGDNSTSARFWLALPWAGIHAVIDRIRGKVVRSHREFLANRDSAVSAVWLNEAGS